jgi:O-methyltransferase
MCKQTSKKLIKNLLKCFGVTLTRSLSCRLVIDHQYHEFVEQSIAMVRPYSMLPKARLSILFEFVQYLNSFRIHGDIVECGVWKGGAMGMMAKSCLYFNDIRAIHLFDSFDDICEPDARIDGERAVREVGGKENAQGRIKPIKGVYDFLGGHGTVDICNDLLTRQIRYPVDKTSYYKGWFQDTLADNLPGIEEIAILHIDADWYASTTICLETFYDRMARGGVIIVDDYGGYDGCRKAVDEFIDNRKLRFFRNHVDHECIYWFK